MGPSYAGILGPIAFVTTVTRGLIYGGAAESILVSAWCHLVAFAAAGFVIGSLASWIVDDSVRSRVEAQLPKSAEINSPTSNP